MSLVELANSYANLLLKTQTSSEKIYLGKEANSSILSSVVTASKTSFLEQSAAEKKIELLTLREITFLGCLYLNDLKLDPANACAVSYALQKMSERKAVNDNKKSLLLYIVDRIYDCLMNFWMGLGLNTTTFLADTLCAKLRESAVQLSFSDQTSKVSLPASSSKQPSADQKPSNASQQSFPNIRAPENVSPNQWTVPAPSLAPAIPKWSKSKSVPSNIGNKQPKDMKLITHYTSLTNQKRNEVITYFRTPDQCKKTTKQKIFLALKSIQLPNDPSVDPTTSLVGLMLVASEKNKTEEIDLTNPDQQKVLTSVMKDLDSAEMDLQLIEFLTNEVYKQNKFPLNLFIESIHVYSSKNKVNPFIFQRFLQFYIDSTWHLAVEGENQSPVLPVNDERIVKLVSLLLKLAPNNDITLKYMQWILTHSEISLSSVIDYLFVFHQKEVEFQGHKNLVYPAQGQIISCINNHPDWALKVLSDKENCELAYYLIAHGVRIEYALLDLLKLTDHLIVLIALLSDVNKFPNAKEYIQPLFQAFMEQKTSAINDEIQNISSVTNSLVSQLITELSS